MTHCTPSSSKTSPPHRATVGSTSAALNARQRTIGATTRAASDTPIHAPEEIAIEAISAGTAAIAVPRLALLTHFASVDFGGTGGDSGVGPRGTP
jgi:hypothetical protein